MYEVLASRGSARGDWGRGGAGEARRRPTADDRGRGGGARDRIEWDLPDLFVVDGGRGQLGVALAAAQDLGLHDLPIVGLAKEKENVAGETLVDRVYLPGQKNPHPAHGATRPRSFFLARLRDEAHRFSNRARERLGKARRLRSELDGIPGIGPATKKALLLHLGTVAAVKVATDEALAAVPGVRAPARRRAAQSLRRAGIRRETWQMRRP